MQKTDWVLFVYDNLEEIEAERNMHYVSLNGLQFINSLMRYHCKYRPSIDDVINHSYLTDEDSIKSCVTLADIIKLPDDSFKKKLSSKVLKDNML